MMLEAGVVLDLDGNPIHWHAPKARTGGSLPDDKELDRDDPDRLWPVLWENRNNLLGVAHSHPGGGIPGPSQTDVTTFSAIERALGRLKWWIVAVESQAVVLCQWTGPGKHTYGVSRVGAGSSWVAPLIRLSKNQMK